MLLWIVVVIVAHQIVLLVKRRHFDPLDFFTFIDVVIFVLFVYGIQSDPAIAAYARTHPSYVLTIIAGILALYTGLHWPTRRSPAARTNRIRDGSRIDTRWLWWGFAIYLLAAYVVISAELNFTGLGFFESIIGDRLSAYLGGGILQPVFWSQVMIAAFGPSLILLVNKTESHQWMTAGLLYGLLLVVGLATFHTRLGLIILLSYPIVYFHYRVRRITWPGFIALFGGFMVLMIVLNQWRNVGLQSVESGLVTSEGLESELNENLSPLLGYDWIMLEYEEGRLEYEYGRDYADILVTFVPRSIWPRKPITSFEGRWTEKLARRALGSGVGVWTFTAWGEGLVQFGLPGLVLNLFLYGFLVSRCMNRFKDNPIMLFVIFQYSVFAATFLRASFQAIAVYSLVFLIPALVAFWLATRRSVTQRQEAQELAEAHRVRIAQQPMELHRPQEGV